jgi:hypothetical protein
MTVSGIGTVPLEAVARDGGLKAMPGLLAGVSSGTADGGNTDVRIERRRRG